MRTAKEIKALIRLLEDPDETIYGQIKQELKSFGEDIIPRLESHWEFNRFGHLFQSRVEDLIHEIQFGSLENQLLDWWQSDQPDLLEGVTYVTNYKYPNLTVQDINSKISKYTNEIWLELNDYLTAYEKVNMINHFIFKVHRFRGNIDIYYNKQSSFINTVLDTKQGDPLSLSILYVLIGRQLDLPIYGVNLPRHFIVAYLDPYRLTTPVEESPVLFYINPFSGGEVFGSSGLSEFLKKSGVPEKPEYFQPCNYKTIVKRLLNNLIYAYSRAGDFDRAEEIKRLTTRLTL